MIDLNFRSLLFEYEVFIFACLYLNSISKFHIYKIYQQLLLNLIIPNRMLCVNNLNFIFEIQKRKKKKYWNKIKDKKQWEIEAWYSIISKRSLKLFVDRARRKHKNVELWKRGLKSSRKTFSENFWEMLTRSFDYFIFICPKKKEGRRSTAENNEKDFFLMKRDLKSNSF